MKSAGSLTLIDCTISGNSGGNEGGGIYSKGTLTMLQCSVSNNTAQFGGAIYAYGGSVTLTACTLSGNTAVGYDGGGLDCNSTQVNLTDCTISDNTAGRGGGGLSFAFDSHVLLTNCTISGNTAVVDGGVGTAFVPTPLVFNNNIIAGNTDAYGPDDIINATIVGSNNLIGTGGSGGLVNGVKGNIVGVADPGLAPLNYYGGPTKTLALQAGSLAIDAGSTALAVDAQGHALTTDERGLSRVYGGTVDIGAFESQPVTVTSFTVSSSSLSVALGLTSSFTATGTLAGGTTGNVTGLVTWTSSQPSVATIDSTGLVTTLAEGSTVITATANGLTYTLTLTVTPAVLLSIDVSPTSQFLGTGESQQYTALGTFTNGVRDITNLVSWVSSTPAAVSISNIGLASALTVGSTVITASLDGVTSTDESLIVGSLVVNTTVDELDFSNGTTSLREAIAFASAHPGDDTITFDPTLFSTPQKLILSGGQLELNDTSAEVTITDTAGLTIDAAGASRVFLIDGGVTAAFVGLTITGGVVTDDTGGGLSNYGSLTLINCTLSGDVATGNATYASGGGAANFGTLDLNGCTVSGDSTTGNGGGVFNAGALSLTNCTVSGNTATVAGGGILNRGSSSTDYYGNTTISTATVTLTNVTVADNIAPIGVGILNDSYGTLSLTNSIVAGSTGPDITLQGDGEVLTLSGVNLVQDESVTGVNVINADPMLAKLGNYGGLTNTMALLPGSVALNAGISDSNTPTIDQRGLGRVGAVDLGAFESQGFAFVPDVVSGTQTANVNTAFAKQLAVTVTANNMVEPVDGGIVAFATPASGASATLSTTTVVISAGRTSVAATANGSAGTYVVTASTIGAAPAVFNLTNLYTPTFSALSSTTIVYGTPTVTLTGHLAFGTQYPTGTTVVVTLAGITGTGTVDASGNFSVTFTTTNIGVGSSPYTVTYTFAGTATFRGTINSGTTLKVNPAALTVTADANPISAAQDGFVKNYGAADPVLTFRVTGLQGTDAAATVLTGSLTRAPGTNAGTYAVTQGSLTANPNYILSFVPSTLVIRPVVASLVLTTSLAITVPGRAVTFTATVPTAATGTVTFRNGTTVIGVVQVVNGVATLTTDALQYGSRTITATYSGDGNFIAPSAAGVAVSVVPVALLADPLSPGHVALFVGGTAGNDEISVEREGNNRYEVEIETRGWEYETELTGTLSRVVIYGGAGDDVVSIGGNVQVPVWEFGGDGNDILSGAQNAPNVLVGGAGNDILLAGNQRDILIGGTGSDILIGRGADDLLIGGSTAFDMNEVALGAIQAEWTSTRDFATRVADLQGTGTGPRLNGDFFLKASGPGATVSDDGVGDILVGGSGHNWYFAHRTGNGVHDTILGLNRDDLVSDMP